MEQDDRQARIIPFPVKKKLRESYRKYDLNRNKEGSVRKINGKVYVDFMYLGERVREPSGLPWNRENARKVRDQLDRIVVAVKAGTFRFAEVFPKSNNLEYFTEKERLLCPAWPTSSHEGGSCKPSTLRHSSRSDASISDHV